MNRIERQLSREIGLNASSLGKNAIAAAVKARLRACQLRELSEYVALLEQSPAERHALVEEVVVSETWFFRDEDVFKALGRQARGWLRREQPLRVLSLPCATGEEAYSVSITLLDAGLMPGRFAVHGVDVSERALAQARRGVFGKISFRGTVAPTAKSYFEAVDGGKRVSELAREAVTFSAGNVLDASLFAARSFDVVLCRNLLIYLDAPSRTRALDNLLYWLKPDGRLFAGHAEAVELMDPRFQRQPDVPFAYAVQPRAPVPPARGRSSLRPAAPARPRASARVGGRAGTPEPLTARPSTRRPSLDEATRLANGGKLNEARRVCERVIAEAGASPECYCLLGIINTAAGDRDGAIDCFNKSLYLDQNHYEALVHLALLHEERGEHPAAANFRRRADRARRGEER